MPKRTEGKRLCPCGVEVDRCDGCDDGDYFDEYYDEPPLYPPGKIEGMSGAEIIRERRRQSNIHDAAVDRCEEINSPTIETAMARYRLCDAEIKRRLAPKERS